MTIPDFTADVPPTTKWIPQLEVFVDGARLPNVIDASITRGLDQDVATASVTVTSGLRSNVLKYSQIQIYMGSSSIGAERPRFVGYIVDWTAGIWPGTFVLLCEDPLTLAKGYFNPTPIDQKGKSDTSAVRQVLETAGFPPDQIDLEGVGKKIGKLDESSNIWDFKTSAFQRILDIDGISYGYRTFTLISGRIVRRFIGLVPGDDYAKWFQEGINIIEGSLSSEKYDPATQISIEGTGIKGTVATEASQKKWRNSPYFKRRKLLKQLAFDVDFLNFEELAAYLLSKLGKWLMHVSFVSDDEQFFQTGDIVKVTAAHLDGLDQTLWVQTVTSAIDANGKFTQSFTCVSEFLPTMRSVQNPIGGTPLAAAPAPTPVAPSILADFLFGPLLAEQVIIADAYVTLYEVLCTDMSTSPTGTIVSWAWTVTGGGGLPASSTERMIPVTCTDLATCSVSLTVTDSNAATGTVTRSLNGLMSSRRYRKLYTAATAVAEAWDGFNWRTQPASSGGVVGVEPGPVWWNDETPGIVLHSSDELQSAPSESTPFASQAVTAGWIELDIAPTRTAAGGGGGGLATSINTAASWALRNSPTTDPILRIFISRFNPAEFHLLTAANYYVSNNGGVSWRVILAAAVSETFNDLCLSHTRNMIASNQGVRNVGAGVVGALLTGITAGRNIVNIQPDIVADRFFAVDSTGDTWVMATDGATAFTAGEPYPSGVQALVRATWRDGTIPKIIYIAGGTGGLWKSVDGYETPGLYFQLRKPGVLGAGSGPWLMVGAGDLATDPPVIAQPEAYSSRMTGEFFTYSGGFAGSWTKRTAPFGTTPADLIVNQNNSAGDIHIFALVVGQTSYKMTIDGATSWTTGSVDGNPIYWLATANFDAMYALTSAGYLRSTDNGTSWQSLSPAVPGFTPAAGDTFGVCLATISAIDTPILVAVDASTGTLHWTDFNNVSTGSTATGQTTPTLNMSVGRATATVWDATSVLLFNLDQSVTLDLTPGAIGANEVIVGAVTDGEFWKVLTRFSGGAQTTWEGRVYLGQLDVGADPRTVLTPAALDQNQPNRWVDQGYPGSALTMVQSVTWGLGSEDISDAGTYGTGVNPPSTFRDGTDHLVPGTLTSTNFEMHAINAKNTALEPGA